MNGCRGCGCRRWSTTCRRDLFAVDAFKLKLYNGACPFRQVFASSLEATGFAAANGPWFEKIDGGRAIRGFRPGPQHANALGIVHGGMLAAFLDSAMGTAVFHVLRRRAVTLAFDRLSRRRAGSATGCRRKAR